MDENGSIPPFLRALGKKHYRDKYFAAKKIFFKRTTFKVPLERLDGFLKRHKEYLPLINSINILPPSLKSREYIRITRKGSISRAGSISRDLFGSLLLRRLFSSISSNREWFRHQARALERVFFAEKKREVREKGLRSGVLKVAVVIFDKDDEGELEPVRTIWTSKPAKRMTRYLELAGYERPDED